MIMQVNSEDLIFDVSLSRICEKTVVHLTLPALLAQLDVHPTGDQEVVGLTPWIGNILSWRFDHEIFSIVILSLPLIQEGQLSISGERMCSILVNHLEIKPAQ